MNFFRIFKNSIRYWTFMALLALSLRPAGAQVTKTWSGPGNGDWYTPANWTPAGVPATNDTVNFSSGSINLSSAVTISGQFNWSGGGLVGRPLTVTATGVMTLSGSGSKVLQCALTNAGTITFGGSGDLTVYNNNGVNYSGAIYNLAGALFDFQVDRNISCACYGFEFFNNAGVLRKSASTGTSSIGVVVTNTGTVTTLQGSLNFNNGGSLGGTYNAGVATIIDFNLGAFSYQAVAVPQLNGPGVIRFSGGTLTLINNTITNLSLLGGTLTLDPGFQGGTITNLTTAAVLNGNYSVSGVLTVGNGVNGGLQLLSGSTVNWSGGTLASNSQVAAGGVLNWSGGTLLGPLTVASGGVMTLSGSGSKVMQNVLTNAGTVNFGGTGDITVYNNNGVNYSGAIYNLAGGLFDFQADRNVGCACYGFEYFNNAGLLRKSASTGTSSFGVVVTNTGTVTTLQGIFNFNNGGSLGGTYNAAAGSLINFNSAAFAYQSNALPVLNGPGGIRFTGGTLTLIDNVIPNLTYLGGILTLGPGFQGGTITNLTTGGGLSGNYLVSGVLSVDNGVNGGLQLLNGSTLNWSGGNITNGLIVTNGSILNWSGGTLSGNSRVTDGGLLNWSGGSLLGPLTVTINGLINMVGNGSKVVQNVLTNAGTINFGGGGDLSVYNNNGVNYSGAIYNLPGALFDFQADRNISCACYGFEYFNNAGLLRKSASTGTSSFGVVVTNTGTVTTLQGTFNFNNGGSLGGTYNAAAGTLINFNSGAFTYQANAIPQLNGPGGLRFTGGALTLIDNVIPNLTYLGGTLTLGPNFQGGTITNLTTGGGLNGNYVISGVLSVDNGVSGSLQLLSGSTLNWSGGNITNGLIVTNGSILNWTGGTLSGNSRVTDGGLLNWSGGTLLGPLTVATNGVINMVGSGSKVVQNALTNAGTVNFGGTGDITVYNNNGVNYSGAIYNLPGALFDFQVDRNIGCACYGYELFNNAGLLRKSASTGTSSFGVVVTNTGTVTTLQGIFNFNNGGSLGGTYNAAAGTLINFNSGAFTYQANAIPQLNGPGGLRFTGGALTLIDNLIPNLGLLGGTLTLGPGFQGGTITNLTTGGGLSGNYLVSGILGVDNGVNGGLQLLSGSTLNWSGGNITNGLIVTNGSILNWSGGTLSGNSRVTGDGLLNWSGGTLLGPLTVATNGVINMIGSGSKVVQNALTNAGVITLGGSGDLSIYNNNGVNYSGAIYNLAGALFDFQADRNIGCACYGFELFDNAGMVRKSAGSGTSTIAPPFHNSGTLDVETGTIYFNFNSGYAQAGATVAFGVTATNNSGHVILTGNVNFDGTLKINGLNGYVPKNGDVLSLITYGSRSAIFNALDLPPLTPGLGWQTVYNPTSLQLKVVTNNTFTAQISGSVIDNLSHAVTNLTVFAYTTNSGGSFYLSTTTDVSGHYSLSVSNGAWLVGLKDLPTRGYNPVNNQTTAVSGANQTVNFVLQPFSGTLYTITTAVNPAGAGATGGNGVYPAASAVLVTATANTSVLPYFFANWTENGVFQSSSSSYLFNAQRDRNLVANFALPAYTITVSNNPTGGGIVTGAGTNIYGTTNVLIAQPNPGYNFSNWTENGTSLGTSPTLSTVIFTNHFIVANYSEANLIHVVTTATSPSGIATVSGAGSYTNGQSGAFIAPGSVVSSPNLYTFQKFTLTNNQVTANTNFNKTFATTDPTNLQYVAVYNTLNIVPQVASATANHASPVPATTNLVLTFRFDRSMQTTVNLNPVILLTNTAAAIQATVPTNGHWTTTTVANDTYVTPGITLTNGMDGTNRVFISGATDVNGFSLALTNPLTLTVDATFPVLSNIQVAPGVQTALITWATDEPATSRVEYGLTTNYNTTTGTSGQLVTSHSVTLSGLAAQTTYHFRIHSLDPAGNDSFSNDRTFTTVTAPDLQVNSLHLNGTLISGGNVTIAWNDTNSGAGATYNYWYDQITVTNVFTGQMLLNTSVLYDSTTLGNIASGGSASRQLGFKVPDGAAGSGPLKFIVKVNAYGSQYESNPGGTELLNNTAVIQQTSSLSSYPDLQVANLAVTNASLQSGQTLGITWKDFNGGSGVVSNSFSDRVTIANLTTAQTLTTSVVDYDATASGNILAGQSVDRLFTFALPNGSAGAGNLRVTVATDSGNTVFEYNVSSTGESNNSNFVNAVSSLAPYPDLAATNIVSPATAGAGQSVQIIWTDSNIGNTITTNSWNDQVFLSTTNVPGGGQLLGTFSVTNILTPAQSLTLTQAVTIPTFATGTNWFIVKANASGSFYELNTSNNTVVSTQAVKVASTLALSLGPTIVSESAGANAVTGSLTRNGDVSLPLTVNLSSAPGTNVAVPVSVIIPAGQHSANFSLSILDKAISGGSTIETISANASGFPAATAPLTILFDDAPALTLVLSTNQILESGGAGAATGTIRRNVNFGTALTVTLFSDLPTAVTVPPTVIIPAGQTNASFSLTAVDDSVVGDTRRAHISAGATGFGNVSATMDILNTDASQLSVSFADAAISKGAHSPATIGTVTRSIVYPTAQDVVLSVTNNPLVTVPTIVTIPANAASAIFNVSVGDDSLATGTKPATVTAQMLTPTHIVITNGQTSATLTVLDTHGPSLSLIFADSTIAKGSNTTGMVTRNTATTTNLVVNLSASPSAAITFPPTVTIPAGQHSMTFQVTGVLDGVFTGPRKVAFTAASSGFNSAAENITVSDIYMPDLLPTSITLQSNALTGQAITVSWVVANNGLSAATNSWYDAVFLATDNVGSGQLAFAYATNKSSLAVGQSYTNQATLAVPTLPGSYWIVIGADTLGSVSEINKQNNSLISAHPIVVNPLYRAAISNVTPAVAAAGTPVTFTGRTYFTADNSPAPLKTATIHVVVNDTRRLFSVTSDAGGNFSYTFQPLPGEAGDYTVGADYPLILTDPAQSGFSLLGMQAIPGGLVSQLLPAIPMTNKLILSNLTSYPLTGLGITVPDLSGNLTTQFVFTNQNLPANGAISVDCIFQSPITRNAQIKFTATATSAEGAQANIPMVANVVPLVPQLTANPGFLNRGMLVGSQTLVSFDILNTGGASSGDLTLQLPTNLTWLTLSSPEIIPSIPAGGKATVTLTLNPPVGLPLTLYAGNLAAVGDHTGVSVPFQFRAVSDGKGDLRVTATDDYTYYVAGAPKVTNALVTVRDAITTAVIAQTNTDANGIAYFSNLPEGPYTVDATATKHNQFRSSASVVAGITTDLEAFMPRQLVSYQWTVVPTEIADHYTVQLESTFETEVPVPNVVVEEPSVMLLVTPGQISQFDIKLTNLGLIAANGVEVIVPDDPNYIITPLVKTVGVIPAKSSVTVPVTVQSRAFPASLGKMVKLDGGGCDTSQLGFHGCLPSIGLGVQYYYVCGPNNVLQQRSVDLSVACTTKNVYDCLKDIVGITGSQNLRSLGCNTLSAFLSCVASQSGVNLDPCAVMGINIACGALTGGAAGALGGGLGSLPDCICAHLDLIPLPSFPHSTATGGGGDLLLPIFPTGAFYVSGGPVGSGISFGTGCGGGTPTAANSKTVTKISAYSNPLKLRAPIKTAAGGVCAKVRLRIEQSVIMTRSAFSGTLEIDNGGDSSISNIKVTLAFQDSTNGNAAGKFFVEGPILSGFSAVDGTGSLAGGATGSAVYTFIPTIDAAPTAPQSFQIGGTLSYMDNGEEVVVPLLSAPITVYPEAKLDLVYFQQRDVYGDDPFTDEIEPSEPFALGLIVKNTGAGNAHNLSLTSGQPQIIDNQKGLLIDFKIIGTEVGNQPVSPSLTANLGDITPGGTKEVTWDMISSLQGRFISFDASFKHSDDLGGTNTSLINSVQIHELTHRVLANRTGVDDDFPDFLVNDIPDPANLPDLLYLSDGSVAPVAVFTNAIVDAPVGPGHLHVQLFAVVSNGWNYIQIPDPGPGYLLKQVMRSDGKIISLTNDAWTTDRSFPSSITGAIEEHLVHVFDFAGTGSYTLFYGSTNTTPPAIVQVVGPTPFTQSGAISAVDVIFSALVDTNTFSFTNLTLSRDGGANLITSGSGISLTLVSNFVYSINGLASFTANDGNYQITVQGNGIYDLWGNNAGNVSASASWAKGNSPVVVQSIAPASPNPRNAPLDATTVTFSKPINGTSFDFNDLSLTLNGGANLINSSVTITPVSSTVFTISGLGALSGAEGSYTLTVNAAAINDDSAVAGFGAQSTSWSMLTTPPKITALEQLATNPRNIVVQALNVTFSAPINPATFDYHDLALTHDGGPNLITSAVTVSQISSNLYKIANFNWVQGLAGSYTLTVSANNIADLAGNTGSGATNETWTLILTTPPSPTNLVMTPDFGISATDGLTRTNTVTLTGSVGVSNLTVRVSDDTTVTDLGTATVNGTNFSDTLTFGVTGHHRLKFTSIDVAGNVSVPTFFDMFVDIVPPTAVIQQVTNPIFASVASISVSFSEPININTLSATNFVLTRDGTNSITPTLTSVSSNTFLLGSISLFTFPIGNYQLTLNLAGVQDLAGNSGTNNIVMSWLHDTTNAAPSIDLIPNMVIAPDNNLSYTVIANDANGDTLTFSLDPGAPPIAQINPTNGLFSWTPRRVAASTTRPITVRVTDNGFPPLSSTQTFQVTVLDYLDIAVGSTNVQGGNSVGVPVYLASSEGVTNLAFNLIWPGARFTNAAIAITAPGIAASQLQNQFTNLLITLQTTPGQVLQSSQQVLNINFTAVTNQTSAFVPLKFGPISAIKPGNITYSNYVTRPGVVTVVQDKPLLVAGFDTNNNRRLMLLGRLNQNYQLQFGTNLFGPWSPFLDYTQTNDFIFINVAPTNGSIFYRVHAP